MPMVRRWHQEIHIKPYYRKYGVYRHRMQKLHFFIDDIDTKTLITPKLLCRIASFQNMLHFRPRHNFFISKPKQSGYLIKRL